MTVARLAPAALKSWALETVLTFVVATAHLQTNDPGNAMRRLGVHLVDQDWPYADIPDSQRAAARRELDRVIARIAAIQHIVPRRIVD